MSIADYLSRKAANLEAAYWNGTISGDQREQRWQAALDNARDELRRSAELMDDHSAAMDLAIAQTKRYGAPLRYKDAAIGVKDGGSGSFEALVAVYGNRDRQNDVIEPGAVQNLDEFAADGVILVNHDMLSPPVAYIEKATQDARGLLVSGRFHSTERAQEIRTIILERQGAGKSVKCSIGFRVLDGFVDKVTGISHLTKINVYEASFVGVPANPMAGVTSAA